MKKFSLLLCIALFAAGIVQGRTYNETATAQLLEFLQSLGQEVCGGPGQCVSKAEVLSIARKKMAQLFTIIENGANPNIVNPDGRGLSLLTCVVLMDFFCIVLQAAGQSQCAKEQLTEEEIQEFTAAVHSITKLLLEHGADPNIRNNDGSTALFWASSAGIARLLIDYGADRSLQDGQGQTALQHHESQKCSMLADIAQGKGGGWPFNFAKDTMLDLVARCEAVIEVLKTYRNL